MNERAPVSLSSGSLWGLGIARTAQLVSSAGLDGMEVVVDPEIIARGPTWLARHARDAGVRVTSLHPFLYALPGALGAPWAPTRLAILAAAAGIPVITTHPPITSSRGSPTWSAWLREIAAARALAERENVSLSIENPPVFRPADRRKVLVRTADLLAFCAAEGLSMTYDTAHAWSAGDDVVASCASVIDRIVNLHLSDVRPPPERLDRPFLDSFYKHHQLPGVGILPLEEVLRLVSASAYGGPITLELSPVALGWPRAERIRERLAEAALWVRERLSPGTTPVTAGH